MKNFGFQGWCSNLNGLTGMMVAIAKGLLHSIPSPPNTNIDVIPVDFVVNSIIAAGWKTGLCRLSPKLTLESLNGRFLTFSLEIVEKLVEKYYRSRLLQ